MAKCSQQQHLIWFSQKTLSGRNYYSLSFYGRENRILDSWRACPLLRLLSSIGLELCFWFQPEAKARSALLLQTHVEVSLSFIAIMGHAVTCLLICLLNFCIPQYSRLVSISVIHSFKQCLLLKKKKNPFVVYWLYFMFLFLPLFC